MTKQEFYKKIEDTLKEYNKNSEQQMSVFIFNEDAKIIDLIKKINKTL